MSEIYAPSLVRYIDFKDQRNEWELNSIPVGFVHGRGEKVHFQKHGKWHWKHAIRYIQLGVAQAEGEYEGGRVRYKVHENRLDVPEFFRFPKRAIAQKSKEVPKGFIGFEREVLFMRDAYHCTYCDTPLQSEFFDLGGGERLAGTVDHYIPKAHFKSYAGQRRLSWGVNAYQNIVASCYDCNSKKASEMPVRKTSRWHLHASYLRRPYLWEIEAIWTALSQIYPVTQEGKAFAMRREFLPQDIEQKCELKTVVTKVAPQVKKSESKPVVKKEPVLHSREEKTKYALENDPDWMIDFKRQMDIID